MNKADFKSRQARDLARAMAYTAEHAKPARKHADIDEACIVCGTPTGLACPDCEGITPLCANCACPKCKTAKPAPLAKHTLPAELHVGGRVPAERAEPVSYIGIGDGCSHIARAVITGCVSEPEAWANARELARRWNAYPDLLRVAQLFMAEWNDTLAPDYRDTPLETIADAARAAIAKAQA